MSAKARNRIAWLTAAQRFDWRIAPGEKQNPDLPITCQPGVVHGVLKERNR